MGKPGPASGPSVPICLFPQLSPLQRAREHAGTSPGPARLPIAHANPQLKTLRKHMITSKLFKRSNWYEHETVTRPREGGSLTACEMCVPQADSDQHTATQTSSSESLIFLLSAEQKRRGWDQDARHRTTWTGLTDPVRSQADLAFPPHTFTSVTGDLRFFS